MIERDPVEIITRFQNVLERCSLLTGLNHDEMSAVLRRVRFEGFTPGDGILTEGKQYHGLWVVLSGTCEVVKHGHRTESRLAILEPGHVFGEMSFLHSVAHSASVMAVDHVETMRLMREEYDDLSSDHPSAALKLAINIIHVLSDRLRRMDEWTCELVEKGTDTQRHMEWQDFRSKLYTNLFE